MAASLDIQDNFTFNFLQSPVFSQNTSLC